MDRELLIRSRTNARIRRAASVLAGKEPELVALEGERLVDDALRANVELVLLLVAPERIELAARAAGRAREIAWVEPELLRRTSGLEHGSGVLALARTPGRRALDELPIARDTLLLVTHGVADPGNLGALARSAEALGATGICPIGGAAPFHPRALRGSMGSLLRVPVYAARSAGDVDAALRARGVRQVAAATRGGADPARHDWSGPLALWIAGETGDAPPCAERYEQVTIPMRGAVESLNVAVAASLLLYAAGRVRARGSER